MQLVNHEPLIKTFGNGFQITFANRYTVLVKNGLGAQCTQTKSIEDTTAMIMASRLGGNSGPDVEVEVYDPTKQNITSKFGDANGLGFVTPFELVNLLYIVSGLKDFSKENTK
jgi:hypothetical protein